MIDAGFSRIAKSFYLGASAALPVHLYKMPSLGKQVKAYFSWRERESVEVDHYLLLQL